MATLFKPSATPQEVAEWCEKEFAKAHEARQSIERQWLLNLAFYYGKQWVTWSPHIGTTARLYEPKAPAWRVRLTVNKIQPYIRREMARLSSQQPRGFVLPASSEEDDRSAARAAEAVLDYLHDEIGVDEVMDSSDWWACICGPSYLKVRYVEEIDPSTNQPGRIRVDVVRPFDIYVPDLEETRITEQKWVAHVQSLPLSEIREKFGVDATPDSHSSEVDQKVRNVMTIFSQNKGDDYAVVKEFWIKPCAQYPKGLVVAVANNKVLPYVAPEPINDQDVGPNDPDMMTELTEYEEEIKKPKGCIDWPFGHGRLPFIQRGHTKSGRFYDTSFVEQIISLQREYNRSRSQIIENKNLTSRPQWAVPIGAVDRSQLTTEPGAVISYAPGFQPPTPIQVPMLPNYVVEHVKLTAEEMDEIASQNEVSKGGVPPGVEAATAIAYLQERDDSAITYAIRNKERAMQEMGRQILSLVTEFWDVPRVVRVVGKNEIYNSFELMGSDLRDNIDYRVVTGSGAPISRAAQKAEILEMVKSGMLPATKGLRLLNMPDVAAVIEEVEIDTLQASKENLLMGKAQLPPVEVWHDHVAHLEEHDSYKKREEYQHLDDQAKAIIRYHDYQHLMQLAMLFNMMPPSPPPTPDQMMQQQMNPMYVDPAQEFLLRQVYIQLKAGGGAPPPPSEGSAPA